MNNLIVKQVLRNKNVPEEIGEEIVKYLPLPEQEKKKKVMIRQMNIWYNNYWSPVREVRELLEDPMLLTAAAPYRGTARCWIRQWRWISLTASPARSNALMTMRANFLGRACAEPAVHERQRDHAAHDWFGSLLCVERARDGRGYLA